MPECTYCGSWDGEDLDHVIPISFSHPVGRRKGKYIPKKGTVPACKECNILLSDKPFFTIGSRAGYLLARYEQRYKKILNQPMWTEEELDELGPNMRQDVLISQKNKEEVKRKLKYLMTMAKER